jgi:hypothetical protein
MNPTLNSGTGQTGAENAAGGEPVLSIRGIRPGVTRVSRRAVMLTGIFGAALVGAVVRREMQFRMKMRSARPGRSNR